MELTCPKCQGAMRSYERNGVTIDQCTECRGVFLDRGELDRLIDAENSWHGAPTAPASTAPAPSAPPASGSAAGAGGLAGVVSEVVRHAQSARSSGHGSSAQHPGQGYSAGYGGHQQKRKKSFLDELFG